MGYLYVVQPWGAPAARLAIFIMTVIGVTFFGLLAGGSWLHDPYYHRFKDNYQALIEREPLQSLDDHDRTKLNDIYEKHLECIEGNQDVSETCANESLDECVKELAEIYRSIVQNNGEVGSSTTPKGADQ